MSSCHGTWFGGGVRWWSCGVGRGSGACTRPTIGGADGGGGDGVDDLIRWLRQQFDVDEQVIVRNRGDKGLGDDAGYPDYRTYDGEDIDAADDYLGRFPPPRMAAEVKAKRELLDCLVGATGNGTSRLVADGEPWAIGSDVLVKLMARPYAGRAGWREEWAA